MVVERNQRGQPVLMEPAPTRVRLVAHSFRCEPRRKLAVTGNQQRLPRAVEKPAEEAEALAAEVLGKAP